MMHHWSFAGISGGHKDNKILRYKNLTTLLALKRACGVMDSIPGFGPVDLGSNPSRLVK